MVSSSSSPAFLAVAPAPSYIRIGFLVQYDVTMRAVCHDYGQVLRDTSHLPERRRDRSIGGQRLMKWGNARFRTGFSVVHVTLGRIRHSLR